MRQALASAAAIAAIAACIASNASAEALYRGRGPGIRVGFRVRDGAVYFARVRTVLKCVRDGRRVRTKLGKSLGPARIRDGRFRNVFETEEPGCLKGVSIQAR